jgi:hypothetical protein
MYKTKETEGKKEHILQIQLQAVKIYNDIIFGPLLYGFRSGH